MLSLYSIYGGEDDRDDGETEKAGRHNMWTLLLLLWQDKERGSLGAAGEGGMMTGGTHKLGDTSTHHPPENPHHKHPLQNNQPSLLRSHSNNPVSPHQ